MDYTIMIIVKQHTVSGTALTSQLKTFQSRPMADKVAESVERQANKSSCHIEIIKLYIQDEQ